VLPWNRHSLALLPPSAERQAHHRSKPMGLMCFARISLDKIDKLRCFGNLGIVFCSLYKHTRNLCPHAGFDGVAGPEVAEKQQAAGRLGGTAGRLQIGRFEVVPVFARTR